MTKPLSANQIMKQIEIKCPHCGGDIDMQAKGGRARAAKLTDKRRAEIARKAAAARWKDHQPKHKRKQR